MKKLVGSAPRTHLLVQPPLLLPEDSHWANVQHFLSPTWGKIIRAVSFSTTSQEPDLSTELVRSSRDEQEAQEDQSHHQGKGVPDLKKSKITNILLTNHHILKTRKLNRHMTQPPPDEQPLQHPLRHTHRPHQDALQVQARVQPTSQWFPRALNAASISKSSANHKAPLKTVRCY